MRLKSESPKIAFFATVDVAKGLVAFDDFAPSTIINHFDRKFPFVDKQRLTQLIQKRHGSTAPHFTQTVLAENLDRETINNVKTTVYMNLLKSFANYTYSNYSIKSSFALLFDLFVVQNFFWEFQKKHPRKAKQTLKEQLLQKHFYKTLIYVKLISIT